MGELAMEYAREAEQALGEACRGVGVAGDVGSRLRLLLAEVGFFERLEQMACVHYAAEGQDGCVVIPCSLGKYSGNLHDPDGLVRVEAFVAPEHMAHATAIDATCAILRGRLREEQMELEES